MNDVLLQAVGSFQGGRMLFLGLGTGLGSAMVVDGAPVPLELDHLPYRKKTFEHYVGAAGLKRAGPKKWRKRVSDVIEELGAALLPEYLVLGGGNAKKLDDIPEWAKLGDNELAFEGGFRLWRNADQRGGAEAGRPHLRSSRSE